MKKRNLVIGILAIVVIIQGYYFIKGRGTEESLRENSLVIGDHLAEANPEEGDRQEETRVMEKPRLEVAVGQEAPNFTLKNLQGQEVSLEEYRGKTVLLNFWATWCVFCDIEMPDLQKIDRENEDLVVLAVDVLEDKETVEKYITENKYEFEVLLDQDGAISRLYLVGGYPSSYFIDGEGVLRKIIPGMMTYDQMKKAIEEIKEY